MKAELALHRVVHIDSLADMERAAAMGVVVSKASEHTGDDVSSMSRAGRHWPRHMLLRNQTVEGKMSLQTLFYDVLYAI